MIGKLGRSLVSVAGVIFLASIAHADTFFNSKVDYLSGDSPVAVAIGDLNNDTHPDLVVELEASAYILTYLGNGDGTFAPYASSLSPAFGWNLAIGNINGDAWPDLARPNEGSGILLNLGNGTGTFGFPVSIDTPGPSYLILGDFKEDGFLDIAGTNYLDNGNVVIHIGTGDGTFDAGTTFATTPGPRGLATADINNDGHLDLVVAVAGTAVELNLVSVLLGNGDGTFNAKTDYQVNRSPYGVQIADLNGDGKLDIVTAGTDGKVAVLLGNGSGGFGTKTEFVAGENCFALAVADIDGDGVKDLIVPDAGISLARARLAVLRGIGDGTFEPPVYHGTMQAPLDVAVADLNHDGKPDAVTANRYADFTTGNFGVSVLLNCVPCPTTAVSVALERLEAYDGKVEASWAIPTGSSLLGTVQRRQDGGDWANLTSPAPIEGPVFTYTDGSVTPGLRYAYRLSLRDQTDAWYTNEGWILVPSVEAAPGRLSLRTPFPNPSRAGVSFRIGQPEGGRVQLHIFDAHGREVAKVLEGFRGRGWSEASWSGSARLRAEAPSGVYFAVLESNGEVVRRKFVLVR